MRDTRGFTLVELLVAITVLSVGILALAASSGSITRSLTGSRNATAAAQLAARRVDMLRAAAASTRPRCASPSFAGSAAAVLTGVVTETWTVPTTGQLRDVRVIVSYPRGGGKTAVDTVASLIAC